MKQILLIMAMFSLATQLGYSQERTDYKKERKLVRVTSYHDNGKLAQKGYLKSNKLVSPSRVSSRLVKSKNDSSVKFRFPKRHNNTFSNGSLLYQI